VLDFKKSYGPAIKNVYARSDLATDETFRDLALKTPTSPSGRRSSTRWPKSAIGWRRNRPAIGSTAA